MNIDLQRSKEENDAYHKKINNMTYELEEQRQTFK